tara:strand:- start:35 stop:988 length:954 start_codon:yes stop_codon:yes gene_type:complete
MTQYGKKTKGHDNILYKSMFEAEFANKFLYEKYDYTYEERYYDGTTCSADFYIKDLDCWLELVYFPIGEIYAYESKQILNLPRCYYDDRHDAKKFGAKWNASQKTWYITPQDHSPQKIKKIWHWMYPKDFAVVDTTQRNMQVKGKDYEKGVLEKIERNRLKDKKIFMIHYEDMSKCDNFTDIIRIKDNDFFLKLWREDRNVRAIGLGMSLNEDRIADEIVEAKRLIDEVVTQNKSITSLKKEIETLSEKNKRLETALEDKVRQCKNQKDAITGLTKAIERLKKELRAVKKSIPKLPVEVVRKKKPRITHDIPYLPNH